ncbi:endonuclease/exonuclease/phosphatase family protein [Paenibacillus sp.]|uniref:endonuclease/exonuclease/phosphatase family protein n=1 Tax=Paenibacillus sp. TaxID=58172 RepID=UPI002D65B896|nr:endonuclease/exonuclease/phosphatase family protein [Paenibacillus sp.]HZG58150.1 endonuclease/exonuclease/phosphatase family protein [Paenibacillus sp.]
MPTTIPTPGAHAARQTDERGAERHAEHAAATVMTFNLRRPSWLDGANAWRYRKAAAADAVLAAAADFVGTQEGSKAMLLELTARLPSYAWLGEGRRGGERDETNAILYREDRWAVEASGTFWLSETPERAGSRSWGAAFPRICTWALFRARRGPAATVAVFNAHLDHISRTARTRGAALAAARLLELRGRTGAPAALIGDFNAGPRSEAVAQLALPPYGLASAYEAFPGGPAAVGATYHGFRGGGGLRGEPIDVIFATAECDFEAASVDRGKYRNRYPSDHYPVSARIRWPVRK